MLTFNFDIQNVKDLCPNLQKPPLPSKIPGYAPDIVDKTCRYQTFKQLSLEKSWFNGPRFLLNNDFNIKTENESFTKLTRHLAWIIKLLKNWLNLKRGHASKDNFNYLKFIFKTVEDYYFIQPSKNHT